MPRRAIFLAAVTRDALSIIDHIVASGGSGATAKRFAQNLQDRCHWLASLQSVMGPPRPEFGGGVRSSPYGNHVIFFRYRGDRSEVLAILERHRDAAARFKSDDS